jgi:CarD family transcriptional regulator
VDRQLVDIEKTDQDMSFERKVRVADSTAQAAEFVSQHSGAHGKQKRFGFVEDDFVVYPAHGVGRIVSIEEQIIAGATLEFFVIYFKKAKLTVRVPTRKAANVGMRSPSDLASIHRVKQILGETARRVRGTWSRLALEYASKINSGDITAITEVVRDLYRPGVDTGQSFSERQLYETALDRLSEEMALVEGISREQSVENVEGLLRAGKLKRSA